MIFLHMKDPVSHPRQRKGNLHIELLHGHSAPWKPWLLPVGVRKSFSIILCVQNLNSFSVLCPCNFKSSSYVSQGTGNDAKKKMCHHEPAEKYPPFGLYCSIHFHLFKIYLYAATHQAVFQKHFKIF